MLTPELQDKNSQIHIFSSFCKQNFSPIGPTVQKITGDELLPDNRQTDRQTDRQTFLSWPSSICEKYFFFFFFWIWEGEIEWGEIYTSLLATQVCFAHLLCSQGDNNFYSTKHSSLFSKWSNDLCSSSFQACFEHCWNQAANKLSLADKNNKQLNVITYSYLLKLKL